MVLAACGSDSQGDATQSVTTDATPEATTATASTGSGDAANEAPAPSAMLAPTFELPTAAGDTVSLASFAGEKNLVLVFYRGFW